MWIVAINGEEPITYQVVLDELNCHQTLRGKSNFKISLCRRKSYQGTDLEEIRFRFDQVRPVVSNLEVRLPKKPPTPKNIDDALGGPQRQFWKEALFVQYEKNKNVSLISAPIPIKPLPEVTKVLRSLIASSIKEGDCSDAWKSVARHCANGSSQIKGIDFDQSYSPVAHAESLRINIAIASMHRLTSIILDVSNAFKNTNVPIHERFCVSPPPYYLDWFEISYPNVPLNRDDGVFCLHNMNVIQGTKPAGRQCNRLLDAVVTIFEYKKSTIDHAIYIKVLMMTQCPILESPLMIFLILLITRTHFLY